MKNKLLTLTLAALLLGCSTAQLNTAASIVDPLAVGLVSGYASQFGIPPALTSSVLTPVLNDAWGILAQKYAGNPIAQGAAVPAVGAAAAAANPTTAQLVSAIGNLTLAKSNPAVASAILAQVTAKTSP